MKYYSEVLKKFFDTDEECYEAEQKDLEKKRAEEARKSKLSEERKARAKEVEDAYKEVIKARNAYDKLLTDFVKDYGSFHMSISEPSKYPLFDLLENILDF